jgi:hypothetical protein
VKNDMLPIGIKLFWSLSLFYPMDGKNLPCSHRHRAENNKIVPSK